jgi:catechol 2,3-dioxygenase-like lactoylglutathione lyase family enzyme
MALRVNAIDHVVLNVSDVEVSAAWYQKVLGMTRQDFVPAPGRAPRTALQFGRQKLNLRPRAADRHEWSTAEHPTAGSEDLCFLTESTPEQVAVHLGACGVSIVIGPVAKVGALGTLISVYCHDPDGSLIEISSYRDGSG